MDRRFPAVVRTGNGQLLYGESMYPGNHFSKASGRELELVYMDVGTKGGAFCYKGSLSKAQVGGKMVICDRGVNGRAEKSEAVKEAGGAAMILANAEINEEEDSVDVHVLPATAIGYKESIRLKRYMNSTRRPIARLIFGGTTIGRSRAPASSRGPSLTSPSVLKPDIIAPGVNIIAAWPENLGPSGIQEDHRRSNFSVLSGTSMSCPHVSGVTALIRSAHPSWSPAVIRSAIMTTADISDHYGKPILDRYEPAGFFAMGAGHVNPARAIDPGLVYDINPLDYVSHLCTLGYTKPEIFTITHKNTSCADILQKNKYFSLNYPSISIAFKKWRTKAAVQRTVTNVGPPNSSYMVEVSEPKGVRIQVTPKVLTFKEANEKKSYRVWFESRKKKARGVSFAEGQITWKNLHQKQYKVRSPVSVSWAG
ncbi:uncharacterized protein A4U43_C10F18720 [Asparagus officinalis]|uniref:Subtilisin-like protease fibronectin type-III domain-containing protein n=2 Tax=Asparagus officinalis TaxID=4686 RepID=A0A5P1E8N8_ASPOF|nr:uncharacterized protein A4U43_C10F18720 [Asparagus officinalis]